MFRQMSLFLSERQATPPRIELPCLIISVLQVGHCCIIYSAQDRTWLSALEKHL